MELDVVAKKKLQILSITTAALLALTACGDNGDEDSNGEDQDAEQNAEGSEGDEEAETSDEEDTSDEDTEASEDSEDTDEGEDDAEDDGTEEDSADAAGPPEWDELSTSAGDAIDAAESVDMHVTAPYAGAISPSAEEDYADVEIGDTMTQHLVGEVHGNSTYTESVGDTETTYHFQGANTILVTLEDEIAAAEEQGNAVPFTAEDVDGDYVDYSEELGGQLNFAIFISETHAAMLEFDAPEGEEDTRDGEDVWVYTEGDNEAVFLADEDAPLPVTLTIQAGGDTYEFEYSDWDSAEVPDDISDEEIASQADLDAAAQQ